MRPRLTRRPSEQIVRGPRAELFSVAEQLGQLGTERPEWVSHWDGVTQAHRPSRAAMA